jgi:hypothetical protein
MTNIREILQKLNEDFFLDNDKASIELLLAQNLISKEAITSQWLGLPAATSSHIQIHENRLGVNLPASYKSFLLESNGFGYISLFLNNLCPIEKVEWAKDTEEEWWFNLIEQEENKITDEKYYLYGEEQESVWFRGEYFRKSLKVSEWYDGMCVFLNPIVKFEGEWEVLVYATWYPGAYRYKSFYDFLLGTHSNNTFVRNQKNRS